MCHDQLASPAADRLRRTDLVRRNASPKLGAEVRNIGRNAAFALGCPSDGARAKKRASSGQDAAPHDRRPKRCSESRTVHLRRIDRGLTRVGLRHYAVIKPQAFLDETMVSATMLDR
jgi:hypothetical protein